MTADRLPPGPPGHWLLGNLPEFRRDMLGFFSRCAREYGDLVSVRLGPRKVTLAFHPDFVEQVLVTENRKFGKSYVFELLRPMLGNGLLNSEGEFWLRQRRLMQPAFTKSSVNNYAGTIVSGAQRLLEQWTERISKPSPSGRGQSEGAHLPLPLGEGRVSEGDSPWRGEGAGALSANSNALTTLHHEMSRLTLGIVGRALMDMDLTDAANEVAPPLESAMRDFSRRFESAWNPPVWIPTPRNRRAKRNVRQLDAVVNRIIRQRREEGRDHGDLLSKLIAARDEVDQTGMTDRQLRDEVMTLFLAGHETTANALVWTWYLLAQHPEVERKLIAEISTIVGDRWPELRDVPQLTYTEAVVKESLRLFPPAFAFSRRVLADTTIGKYQIPAGSAVLMSQWVIHRDSRWFDQPDRFLPERWLENIPSPLHPFTPSSAQGAMPTAQHEHAGFPTSHSPFPIPQQGNFFDNKAHNRLPYAYFPFGGGPRVCIGNTFAMLELVLIVAAIAPRFRFQLIQPELVRPWPSVTLRSNNGIPAFIRARSAAPVTTNV